MQSELIERQKQTIEELTKAKQQLSQINEELQAKLEKHVKIHKVQQTNKHEGSLRYMPTKAGVGG